MPPNLQQLIEVIDEVEAKEKVPLKGDQQQGNYQIPQTRFWPKYQSPFHPKQHQQHTTDGGDGEYKPSQSTTEKLLSEPPATFF